MKNKWTKSHKKKFDSELGEILKRIRKISHIVKTLIKITVITVMRERKIVPIGGRFVKIGSQQITAA